MGAEQHQRQQLLVHAFEEADENDSGTLDHDEIAALATSLGAELSESDHQAIREMDTDGASTSSHFREGKHFVWRALFETIWRKGSTPLLNIDA